MYLIPYVRCRNMCTNNKTYVYLFNTPTTILGAKNETSKHVWKYRILYEIPDSDFEILRKNC